MLPKPRSAGVASSVEAATTPAMLLLWGYFTYFLVTLFYESQYASRALILNACLVAAVIGVALNASALGKEPVSTYVIESPFRVLRFFLIPFCVSLFSALVGAAGDEFVSVLPARPRQLAVTVGVSAGVPLACLLPLRCACACAGTRPREGYAEVFVDRDGPCGSVGS